jgi:hypothetical protein
VNILSSDIELYVKCPLAYHLKLNWGLTPSTYSLEEIYNTALRNTALYCVKAIMGNYKYTTVKNHWAKLYKNLPEEYKSTQLFTQGAIFLQHLWSTKEKWNYIAVNHPYSYPMSNCTILGTVDAMRTNIVEDKKDFVLQLVSIGHRLRGHRMLIDVSKVIDRLAYTSVLKSKLRVASRRLQTIHIDVEDLRTREVDDSLRTRIRTKAYIKAIVNGIKAESFYPRYSNCKTCGYQAICDPLLGSRSITNNNIKQLQDILSGDDNVVS